MQTRKTDLRRGDLNDLFGMVETLEIVFSKKRAVLGFPATRHALAEVHPEIIAPPFVSRYPPSRCHPSPVPTSKIEIIETATQNP